jgi:hypothetical protein
MIWAALGIVTTIIAYLLGRKQRPEPPKKERPDDAIKRLDAALDDVRTTPVDELARQLAERARARERGLRGDPPVRD